MKNTNYLYYENEIYEVLTNRKNESYIKDKIKNKYYFKTDFPNKEGIYLKRKIGDYIFPVLIFVSTILYIISFYKYFYIGKINNSNTFIIILESILFMLLNWVLHELGHMFTMLYYGRKIGNIKFKINYIFPTVSVETTDSYILPKFRRTYVYISGLMVNCILVGIVTMLFPKYIYLNSFVLMSILFNFLPIGIVKSDGYHILINILLNVNEYKNKKNGFFVFSQIIFFIICTIMGALTIYKLLVE